MDNIRNIKMADRFWVMTNEDSRARLHRENHIAKNGGVWSRSPVRGWTWTAPSDIPLVTKAPVIADQRPEKRVEIKEEKKPKKRRRLFKKETDD